MHGYAGASVAKVIEKAEVSRATFYEHFMSRAECFAVAYRLTVAQMRAGIQGAIKGSNPLERPRIVVEALLEAAAADPAAARLVLVEALAGHKEVRAWHERFLADVDVAIGGHLESQQGDSARLQIPAVALRSGIGGLITVRICRGEGESLPALRDDLVRWIDSYCLPTGREPLAQDEWVRLGRCFLREPMQGREPPSLLPRGRGNLPPAAAAAARQARILEATAGMTASRGYSELTVSDIVAAARVTRAVFYSHFRSKEDAFLAAQTAAMQEGVAAVASQFSLPASWPERVWAAGETFLKFVAQHPDLAYLDFIAANAAGPEAIRRRHDSHMAFSLFLEDGYRQASQSNPPPRLTSEAIGAAIFGILRKYVVRGRTSELPSLLPTLAYLALAPFIGPQGALAFIEERVRAAR